jgi:hypothetical protein
MMENEKNEIEERVSNSNNNEEEEEEEETEDEYEEYGGENDVDNGCENNKAIQWEPEKIQWEPEFYTKFIEPLKQHQIRREWITLTEEQANDFRLIRSELNYDVIERIKFTLGECEGMDRLETVKLRCDTGPISEYLMDTEVFYNGFESRPTYEFVEFELVNGLGGFFIPDNKIWLEGRLITECYKRNEDGGCTTTCGFRQGKIKLLVVRSSENSLERQKKPGSTNRVALLDSNRVLFIKNRQVSVLSTLEDFKKHYPPDWFVV